MKVRCTNHKQPPGWSSLCIWCLRDLNFIHQLFKLNSSLVSIHVGRGIGQATNLWSKYSLQRRLPNSSALKKQGYTLLDIWSVQVSRCFCHWLPQCEQDFFWCATTSIPVQCTHSCQSIFQLILQPQTSSVHIPMWHRRILAVTWWSVRDRHQIVSWSTFTYSSMCFSARAFSSSTSRDWLGSNADSSDSEVST